MNVKSMLFNQKGAVLILVALGFTVLAGFAGLALDTGSAYLQKNKTQNAIDAAVLAAAQELPDTTKAREVAIEYAGKNNLQLEPAEITFTDNNTKILITHTFAQNTLFLSLLNIKQFNLETFAAAEMAGPGKAFDYAIFSGSTSQDLNITGGGWTVKGSVHTNRNFVLSGGGFIITGAAEAVQKVKISGGGYSIGAIMEKASSLPMPDYSDQVAEAAGENIHEGDYSITGGKMSMDKPLYAKGDIKITGGAFTGTGTIMADGDIKITGGGMTFNNTSQVCFYSKNGDITLTGGGNDFNGVLFAPKGKIKLTGGGVNINGAIVGNRVEMTGGAINVNRDDYPIRSLPGFGARLVH